MDGRVVREMASEPRVVLVRYPCGTTNFSWSIQLAGWSPAALCSLYDYAHCTSVFTAARSTCRRQPLVSAHFQTITVDSLSPSGADVKLRARGSYFNFFNFTFCPNIFLHKKASRDELMSPFLCAFACLGACMASVCAWDYLCVGVCVGESYFVCIPLFV